MAPKEPGKGRVRPKVNGLRTTRNLSYSEACEQRLTHLAGVTGLPRGRIVELALACVDLCHACDGQGTDPKGLLCEACRGTRIVPSAVVE